MNEHQAVTRIADLGESILESISSPTPDWEAIAGWAEELAAVARRAAWLRKASGEWC
jgi:hypothetical protein